MAVHQEGRWNMLVRTSSFPFLAAPKLMNLNLCGWVYVCIYLVHSFAVYIIQSSKPHGGRR